MDPANKSGEPAEESRGGISIRRIEVFNLALTVVATVLAAIFGNTRFAVAALAGGLLAGGSFRVIAIAMGRIITQRSSGIWPVALYILKYLLMIAVIGVLILKYKLDVPGFLIGVSMILPAIVLEAVARPAAQEDQKP